MSAVIDGAMNERRHFVMRSTGTPQRAVTE
jgi:hypothetical protein